MRRGILERREPPEGAWRGAARDRYYGRGPAWDELAGLRERLAAALASR